jgi:hypothetical protein
MKIAMTAPALALAAALAGPAAAQEAQTPAQKTVQATKVFRYLDKFYQVSPADRSKLKVSFYLRDGTRSAYGHHPVLVDGDQRTPLPLAPDGRFERLPTLEQLLRKPLLVIDAPPDARFHNDIEITAAIKPAQEIDAAEVKLAIGQVGAVLRDTVGALAILAPPIRASFPGAGWGVAVSASGAQTPLPTVGDIPVYDPGVQRNAVKLRFAHPPLKVDLTPAK